MFVSYTVFVLSGRSLCDGPIPHSEESYRMWCVLECDQLKSQKPSTPTVNKWVEEGRTKKQRKLSIVRGTVLKKKILEAQHKFSVNSI
jgi:hypothetical protein